MQTSGKQKAPAAPGIGEGWGTAKELAQEMGKLPSSFTVIIRALMADQSGNDKTISPATKYQVVRLLRTPSFKSMMFHASQALLPDKLAGRENIIIGDLINLYQPIDIAALIAGYVLYRRARQSLSDAEWPQVRPQLAQQSQIGGHVGLAIPALGIGLGLLVGTLPAIALATLLKKDWQAFERYVDHRSKKGVSYDLDFEQSAWGCTSAQIASMLLSILGFGVELSEGFSGGLASDVQAKHLPKGTPRYLIKITRLWMDTVVKGEAQPLQEVPGEYYPLAAARQFLDAKVKAVLGGEAGWFEKGRADISPTLTPELFAEREQAAGDLEIPQELADVFSLDEICAMEEEAFDHLLDHLEAENQAAAPKDIFSDKDLAEADRLME